MNKQMNKQINKAAEDMMKNVQNAEVPAAVKKVVLDGVSKSQDANSKWMTFFKDMSKTYEGLAAKAAANTRSINDVILENTAANTQAMFDHAAKVIKTGDVQAAAKAQAEFARKQFEVVGEQQTELLELSGRIAQDMAEAGMNAATATADKFKAAV